MDLKAIQSMVGMVPGYGTAISAGIGILGAIDSLVPSQEPTAYTNQYNKFNSGGTINNSLQIKGKPNNLDQVPMNYKGENIKVSKGEVIDTANDYVFSNHESLVYNKPFSKLAKPYLNKSLLNDVFAKNTNKLHGTYLQNLKYIQEAEMTLKGKRQMQPTQ